MNLAKTQRAVKLAVAVESAKVDARLWRDDEVPVRIKVNKPDGLLIPGSLVRCEGPDVWEVVRVSKASATVRCVRGPSSGARHEVSPSAAGWRTVTVEDAEEAEVAEAAAKPVPLGRRDGKHAFIAETEGEPCLECGADLSDRVHTRQKIVREPSERKSREWSPTPEEVLQVLELRAEGLGYAAIEAAMGWPDSHGNRPWKIVKKAGGK